MYLRVWDRCSLRIAVSSAVCWRGTRRPDATFGAARRTTGWRDGGGAGGDRLGFDGADVGWGLPASDAPRNATEPAVCGGVSSAGDGLRALDCADRRLPTARFVELERGERRKLERDLGHAVLAVWQWLRVRLVLACCRWGGNNSWLGWGGSLAAERIGSEVRHMAETGIK